MRPSLDKNISDKSSPPRNERGSHGSKMTSSILSATKGKSNVKKVCKGRVASANAHKGEARHIPD